MSRVRLALNVNDIDEAVSFYAERWEIYAVLQDSPTFWGQDGGRGWAAVEAALDASA